MGGLGVLFIVFAEGLVRIFNNDPQLVAEGAAAVRVVALTQPAWAVTFALGGALRGLGDTLSPLVISGSAIWICVGLALVIVLWWVPALWGYLAGLSDCWSIRGSRFLAEVAAAYFLLVSVGEQLCRCSVVALTP